MLRQSAKTVHEGKNIKRIRELLGVKQDALAIQLGLSQQAISQLEQKETLDIGTLDKVAKAFGVTADAVKNFSEEATFNIISNTRHDHSSSINYLSIPIGRKIEGVRRLRGMTQIELGGLLGVSKQAVSKMERTEQIDDVRLNEIAKALGVGADTIKNFNEEATFNIISTTSYNLSSSVNYQFNLIEKTVAMYDEKISLYERMLKEKDELIEKLMQKK